MDPLIENLKSTTFFGRRLTRKQIAGIQETARLFPGLSRTELGHTICEHLGWHTPNGDTRLRMGLRLLTELDRLGILTLPPKQGPGRGRQKPLVLDSRSAPQPTIAEPLARLTPLTLELATAREDVALWNQWIQRYHPLGYRQPMGPHLRYVVRDRQQRPLGCLLFSFATRVLPCRDTWIGWDANQKQKQLHLVAGHPRYLLFPWVRVKCLASKVLGQVLRQLARDWQRWHGYRPVLVETFVDEQRHRGTCYRAANWQRIGQTKARGPRGGVPAKTPKAVFVYALQRDWQRILHGGTEAKSRAFLKRRPRVRRRRLQARRATSPAAGRLR